MPFEGSYLWRLRQRIGSELVLIPGAMVVMRRADARVLLTRRADDGTWCLPAGAAEPGGSFLSTACAEVAEEVGVTISPPDLTAYASLSEAETHTIRYANGDVTHCFAFCFLTTEWTGDPTPDGREVAEVRFVQADELPSPVHGPSVVALELLTAYETYGCFQIA